MGDIVQNYYEKFFNAAFSTTGRIIVPSSFHGQMEKINALLSNDKTALVSPIFEFMIKSANVAYSFDANNEKLNKLIEIWANDVNKGLNIDIPKGLRNFTEQFMRERLKSSMVVIRLKWEQIDGFYLPTRMWLMDSSSIHIKNNKGTLNGNEYFFGKPDSKEKNVLSSTNSETILIRKPYNQWYDMYPTPYLVKNGTLYYSMLKEKMLERVSEVINTAFPYQFFIKAGTEKLISQGKGPTDAELKDLLKQFKDRKQEIDEHIYSKGLAGAFPSDVSFEELIPSYNKILDEKIFVPIDKNILSSLGMIELKGFSQNREEMILNPKVLVEEVTDCVADYTDFLQEVMDLIKEKNKSKYTLNDKIEVSPGVIESFVTNEMRTLIRSLYDRGLVSQEDTLEDTTPLKFKTQIKKRDYEVKNKLHIKMYPRVVQNQESSGADLTPNDDIPDDKKSNTPESKNYKNACDDIELITESMKSINDIPEEIRKELSEEKQQIFMSAFNEGFDLGKKLGYDSYLLDKTAMEYAVKKTFEYIQAPYTKDNYPAQIKKLPIGARNIWINTFNAVFNETKDENKARSAAWKNVEDKYFKDSDGNWKKKKA